MTNNEQQGSQNSTQPLSRLQLSRSRMVRTVQFKEGENTMPDTPLKTRKALESKVNQLITDSVEWKFERRKLLDALAIAELDIMHANQANDALESKLASLQGNQNNEAVRVQRKLSLEAIKNEKLEHELASANATAEELAERNAHLEDAVVQIGARLAEGVVKINEENFQAIIDVAQSLQDQLNSVQTRVMRLTDSQTEIAVRHAESKAELESAIRERELYKHAIANAEAASEEYKDQATSTARELEAVHIALKDVMSRYDDVQTQNALKESELTESKQQVVSLVSERGSLDRKVGMLQAELLTSAEQRAELELTLTSSQAKVNQLTADLNVVSVYATTSKSKSIEVDSLKSHISDLVRQLDDTQRSLAFEQRVRRRLQNVIIEMKGSIRVFCRVRPLIEGEGSQNGNSALSVSSDSEGIWEIKVKEIVRDYNQQEKERITHFTFDRVFDSHETNSDIFQEVDGLVQNAMDGYNVCIFAYGQTGSGKTFIMGSKDGIIQLAIAKILEFTTNSSTASLDLTGQFVEIYNEGVYDLLSDKPSRTSLAIRHDPTTHLTHVVGASVHSLNNWGDISKVLEVAAQRRSVGATKMNERSSRSHSVFMLNIKTHDVNTGISRHGVLNLIDLAGSERLNQTQANGERLTEAKAINKSLSCLSDVMHAMAPGKQNAHVPFRNSKLTYLLQNSLAGSAKTLMIVNISPAQSAVPESLSSLRFAGKVSQARLAR